MAPKILFRLGIRLASSILRTNCDIMDYFISAANLSIITEITIKKWLILVNLRQKKKKATENGTKTSSETTFDTRSRFSAKRLLRGVSSSTLPVSTK
jgi:hypothetical protein